MKIDKNLVLTIGGSLLYVAGTIVKGVADKKNEETKLAELVNKAVEDKLKQD